MEVLSDQILPFANWQIEILRNRGPPEKNSRRKFSIFISKEVLFGSKLSIEISQDNFSTSSVADAKEKKLEKSPKAYLKYRPTLASLLLLNILTIRGLKLESLVC